MSTAVPDIESALNDACLMAGVAADRLEDMFAPEHRPNPARPNDWHFGQQDVERTLFAVYQTQKMLVEIKRAYEAGLAGSAET